jgi:outer membrane protein assembly factor BamB
VGASDGFIYAVESKTSKEVWRFRTEHQVNGSPVVYKDSLYCGSVDGNLYCLEYRTGRLRWKFGTGGAITGTPLVYDDIVYIGSTDHQIYALLAREEFLWINFFAGYLAIRKHHLRLPRI